MASVDVSVIVPSIGTVGEVRGSHRVFVVDAVQSVLTTTAVPVEVIVVAGRSMPDEVAGTWLNWAMAAPFGASPTTTISTSRRRSTSVRRTRRVDTCCC